MKAKSPIELSFDVEGMTCASCALRIERILQRQEGVSSAVVSFAGQEARATLDENADVAAIEAAVGKIGYKVTPIGEDEDRRSVFERYDAEAKAQRRNVLGAGALTIPLVLLAMAGPDTEWNRWLQFVLATPVVWFFGRQFHGAAWKQLTSRAPAMDLLISLGTVAAWAYSAAILLAGDHVFFETAGVIITLVLLGRFFEARAKGNASQAISKLMELGARQARLVRDGAETMVDPLELVPGETVVILPGEKIPADGKVVEGRSAIDESMLSGESKPNTTEIGDEVFAGTVNQQGRLVVEVTRVGPNTMLSQIAKLVADAQTSKAPIQKLVDRISAWFVPGALMVAAITFVAWLAATSDLERAITSAVAVLIIACPCALGLATPMAIMVGSGRGAELGVMFKNAEVFERAREVDTVVFDKTGTLTRGAMTLTDVVTDVSEAEFLRLVGSLEAGSEHPVGRAVTLGVEERDVPLLPVTSYEAVSGQGAVGVVDGKTVVAGKAKLMTDQGLLIPERFEAVFAEIASAGRTTFLAGWDGEVKGVIGVADTLRDTAKSAVSRLRAEGVKTVMMTGDSELAAKAIAAELSIDSVVAEVLPDEKAAEVERLISSGMTVAFVGDGINDAPALAVADLGLAIGTGSDIAIEAGDVVLMSGNPDLASTVLKLSMATVLTIRQNLFWAFAYNTAAIPLAAVGILNPMIAAGAMAFSSVSVVTNSLRLRRFGRTNSGATLDGGGADQ